MTYSERDAVVLARDLPEHNLRRGDLGSIVLVHGPDDFEVEFVKVSGATQAIVALHAADIRPGRNEDLVAVRPLAPAPPGSSGAA